MKKSIVTEKIFKLRKSGDYAKFYVSDLPDDVLPTDIINIERDHGFYSENESWDAFSCLYIFRERLQTDEEVEAHKHEMKIQLEKSKEDRFQKYLKLKEEFE